MLSAIARLNPHVDMKKIVIGLMDRLSTYAQRESEGPSADEKQTAEEDAVAKLLEKVDLDQEKSEPVAEPETNNSNGTDAKPATESQPRKSWPLRQHQPPLLPMEINPLQISVT